MTRNRLLRLGAVGPTSLILLTAALAPSPASAQYLDARLIPRGLFRISFEPRYTNYNERFALGSSTVADGRPEPLGADLTADSVGGNLFPTVAAAEAALRDIIGDPSYRLNVGAFSTIRDADVRHFPFNFAFGLTGRITLQAHIPIVTTRSQVGFTFDGTDANAGLNLSSVLLGDATTTPQAVALLDGLTMGIGEIEALIAGGSYGCPTGTACDQARASVDRAIRLRDNLQILTGIGGGDFVPFAPLAGSAAGAALLAEITAVIGELTALGATPNTGGLTLPDQPLTPEGMNDLLMAPGKGFEADSIGFTRQTTFGDIELGLRVGVVQAQAARVVLRSTVRLPTGTPRSADSFVDIATGDGQLDVEVGLEFALEGRGVALAGGASYTRQFAHELERRVTSPSAPLAPLTRRTLVTRTLGDALHASVYPTVRLSDAFRVFAVADYYRKSADAYELVDGTLALPVADLAEESTMTRVSFGGGVAYRADRTTTGRTIPIEAGLNYRTALSGSGGLTPKSNTMHVYLRLFYSVF